MDMLWLRRGSLVVLVLGVVVAAWVLLFRLGGIVETPFLTLFAERCPALAQHLCAPVSVPVEYRDAVLPQAPLPATPPPQFAELSGPFVVTASFPNASVAARAAYNAGPALQAAVVLVILLLLLRVARSHPSPQPSRLAMTVASIGGLIAVGGTLAAAVTAWGQTYLVNQSDKADVLSPVSSFGWEALLLGTVVAAFGLLLRQTERLKAETEGLV